MFKKLTLIFACALSAVIVLTGCSEESSSGGSSSSSSKASAKIDQSSKEALAKSCAEELGIKMGDFMMPVRMAVTGSRVSPPLMGSILILGVEKSIERVKRTLEKF